MRSVLLLLIATFALSACNEQERNQTFHPTQEEQQPDVVFFGRRGKLLADTISAQAAAGVFQKANLKEKDAVEVMNASLWLKSGGYEMRRMLGCREFDAEERKAYGLPECENDGGSWVLYLKPKG